ncbi:MAG: nickel-responsive transcriptional regulator NikR [Planctomycetota bacterium]|nr:nickel-responsive transcriptional regulator NikR [Planctomycetota bacterium]
MPRGRRKGARAEAAAELIRFGISIPAALLKKFDQHLLEKNQQNRSDAIRDLIRDRLVQVAWSDGKGDQVATVTLVYDGQSSDVHRRLAECKRAMGTHLMSVLHVRLSPRQELEVLVLRGPVTNVRVEAEGVLAVKGILHGKPVLTALTAP